MAQVICAMERIVFILCTTTLPGSLSTFPLLSPTKSGNRCDSVESWGSRFQYLQGVYSAMGVAAALLATLIRRRRRSAIVLLICPIVLFVGATPGTNSDTTIFTYVVLSVLVSYVHAFYLRKFSTAPGASPLPPLNDERVKKWR